MTTDQLFIIIILLLGLIDLAFLFCIGMQHKINLTTQKVSDFNAAVISAIITDLEQVREAANLPASEAVDRVLDKWQEKGMNP